MHKYLAMIGGTRSLEHMLSEAYPELVLNVSVCIRWWGCWCRICNAHIGLGQCRMALALHALNINMRHVFVCALPLPPIMVCSRRRCLNRAPVQVLHWETTSTSYFSCYAFSFEAMKQLMTFVNLLDSLLKLLKLWIRQIAQIVKVAETTVFRFWKVSK